MELAFEKLLSSWGPGSQGHLEKLVGAPSFHVLLIEEVKKEVLVALDEALGVDLTVLKLLVAISLDALQQRTQCLLLLLPQ